MGKRNIQPEVDAVVQRMFAAKDKSAIDRPRLTRAPMDFACVDGEGLLQVKSDTEPRARLQLAYNLLGAAGQTIGHSNNGAEDLPWPIAELVLHAVMTAEALVRVELES